jgi:hypothetical protein
VIARFAMLAAGLVQPVLCAVLCTLCAGNGLCPSPNAARVAPSAPSLAASNSCGRECADAPAPVAACGGCCRAGSCGDEDPIAPPPCDGPCSEHTPCCVFCPASDPWTLPKRTPELPRLTQLPVFAVFFDDADLAARRSAVGEQSPFVYASAAERRTLLCVWLN